MPRPTPYRVHQTHCCEPPAACCMECEPCAACCGQNVRPCIVRRKRRCQPPVAEPCLPRNHIGFSSKPMEDRTIYRLSYKEACEESGGKTGCEGCKPKCGRPSRCIYRCHPPRCDTYPSCCDYDPCDTCCDLCDPCCYDPPCYDPPPPRRSKSHPRMYCGKRHPILPRNHLSLPKGQFATKDQTTHNLSYQPFWCEDLHYCY